MRRPSTLLFVTLWSIAYTLYVRAQLTQEIEQPPGSDALIFGYYCLAQLALFVLGIWEPRVLIPCAAVIIAGFFVEGRIIHDMYVHARLIENSPFRPHIVESLGMISYNLICGLLPAAPLAAYIRRSLYGRRQLAQRR